MLACGEGQWGVNEFGLVKGFPALIKLSEGLFNLRRAEALGVVP